MAQVTMMEQAHQGGQRDSQKREEEKHEEEKHEEDHYVWADVLARLARQRQRHRGVSCIGL